MISPISTGLLGLCFIRRTPVYLVSHSLLWTARRWQSGPLAPDLSPCRGFRSFSASSKMFSEIIKRPCADVSIVPVLSDNYSYILVDVHTRKGLCVDPAEPAKVVSAAANRGIMLSAVLCTHKHYDHSGGNVDIQKLVPGINVYGSSYEDVPGLTETLFDGETFEFGSLQVQCFRASCHTAGHLMYLVTNPAEPEQQGILFTGDTLFIGGCGRFFEGSASDMLQIMNRLRALPHETLVYCGHEYTVKNLQFAKSVDPSPAVLNKLAWAEKVRQLCLPTIPSTLAEELTYNPFMRTEELAGSLMEDDAEGAMRKLRRMKDRF